MKSQDKLERLIDLCKCGVTITVNDHRNLYQDLQTYIEENSEWLELDDETKAKCIASNSIVEIQFYPDTPIGFYRVADADLDGSLQSALAILKK